MKNLIILPSFKNQNPQAAIQTVEEQFHNYKITTLNSDAIAKSGGVLNCISWNILK